MAEAVERWWLESAEERNAAAPDSFFIPPVEKRQGLKTGDSVKLLFAYNPVELGAPTVERMWVEVVSVVDGGYIGVLVSEPEHIRVLNAGDQVEFGASHVAGYEWTADELGYDPGAFAWARKESLVTRGTRPIHVAMRPTSQSDDPGDSGWLLGRGDETREQFSDADVFAWTDLGWLTDLYPELEPVFRAGEGTWRWLDPATSYVRTDDR